MSDVFDYIKLLNNDLIEQFRGKPNTEVMMSALGRQLQEVYQFFVDLEIKRNLDFAEGKQLDGIGDIVALTRQEASRLAVKMDPGEVFDDGMYRKYLNYKIFLNTNTCTYPDIYNALGMFWPVSTMLYSENPDHPATMFFSTPPLSPEQHAERIFQLLDLRLKAGGVTLIFTAVTENETEEIMLNAAGAIVATYCVTQLPEMFPEIYNVHLELQPYTHQYLHSYTHGQLRNEVL